MAGAADDRGDVATSTTLSLSDADFASDASFLRPDDAGSCVAMSVGFSKTAAELLLLEADLDSFSNPDSSAFCCLTFSVT